MMVRALFVVVLPLVLVLVLALMRLVCFCCVVVVVVPLKVLMLSATCHPDDRRGALREPANPVQRISLAHTKANMGTRVQQ